MNIAGNIIAILLVGFMFGCGDKEKPKTAISQQEQNEIHSVILNMIQKYGYVVFVNPEYLFQEIVNREQAGYLCLRNGHVGIYSSRQKGYEPSMPPIAEIIAPIGWEIIENKIQCDNDNKPIDLHQDGNMIWISMYNPSSEKKEKLFLIGNNRALPNIFRSVEYTKDYAADLR